MTWGKIVVTVLMLMVYAALFAEFIVMLTFVFVVHSRTLSIGLAVGSVFLLFFALLAAFAFWKIGLEV